MSIRYSFFSFLKSNSSLKYSFEIHRMFFFLTISVSMSWKEAKELSTGMETGITWRKLGIVHRTTNEVLFDVIENLDAIVDQRGMIVTAEVSGVVGRYLKNAR